jgi:hypothetical protein
MKLFTMNEVLQLRCELEQMAIIEEVMFFGVVAMLIQVVLIYQNINLIHRKKWTTQKLQSRETR